MSKPAVPNTGRHLPADTGCKRGPCQVLVTMGKQIVPALLQALKKRSGKLRQAAVRALGYRRDPKAYKTLARLARRGKKALRLAAIRALRDFGTKRAIALLKRLAKSRNKAIAKAAAAVFDNLSAATIRRVILRHLSEIKYCYMSIGLPTNPNLQGMVKVSFTITSSGSVGRVAITQSTLNHSSTEACIKQSVQRWRFPKPKGSMPFVTYPFHFKPK